MSGATIQDSDPTLRVAGLTKRHGEVLALDRVDLTIRAGEMTGLVGPNGAGKTTLVSIVSGLVRPDTGSVHVLGVDVLAAPAAARRLTGLVPQELGVYPTLSVRQNIEFFGRLSGLQSATAARRAGELAEAVGLTAVLRRRVDMLAGGLRRRVHVVCGLVGGAPLLLLDEPTVGADAQGRAALLELVREAAAGGAAACYATHRLDEVERLGASVAVLHRGHIVARGTTAELLSRYADPGLELSFAGPAPPLPGLAGVSTHGERIRVRTADPGAGLAAVLRAVGADTARLRSVEVITPGLDAVFAAVTGERYPVDGGAEAGGDARS